MSFKEKIASLRSRELTPKQQTARTVINWVVTALCIVFIVFALVVAIFTIAGANDEHLTRFGDKIYMNVASSSMEPAFSRSDVIIVDAFDKDSDMDKIKVGQVITFETKYFNGTSFYSGYNTHRIVDIKYTDDTNTVIDKVITKGDNVEEGKTESVAISSIIATWGDGEKSGKMLKGVGNFSNWIQDQDPENGHFGENQKVRFFCVVVLPLILLFVIYAFVLIRTLVVAKLENQRKLKAEQVVTVDSLSDEEKRRLAQEYLASLQEENATADENAENGGAIEAESTDESVCDEPKAEDSCVDAPAETSDEEAESTKNND